MAGHWYRSYGLAIRSALPLPEFRPVRRGAAADLTIRLAPQAAQQWEESGASEAGADDFFAAPAGGFVMRVAGVCDYWVHDAGGTIGLAPAAGSDPAAVRLYLLGSALGMVFHQRGQLVLHGATVLHPGGGATLIVGDSGEGKSTLAASLGRAGLAILGDDTMPLWPRPGGGFEVWPGSRMLKLWSDAIVALGGTPGGLQTVGDRLEKFFVPIPAPPPEAAATVREVVVLATGAGRGTTLEPVHGLAAIRTVAANTYRPEYVTLLGHEATQFRLCSELAGSVAVWRLARPRNMTRIGETLDLLRALWEPAIPAGAAP